MGEIPMAIIENDNRMLEDFIMNLYEYFSVILFISTAPKIMPIGKVLSIIPKYLEPNFSTLFII